MDELLKTLDAMSIEDIECVITEAQKLIQVKEQEAIRQAELEKQRKEQERLEAERQRQEEIARLQQRLKELQGESYEEVQPETSEKSEEVQPEEKKVETVSQEPDYSMITCPQCHKLVPSDSRFCFYCGKPIGSAKQSTEPQQNAPEKTSVFMGDDMKKWDMLAGEGEILGWKEINVSEPEKKPFAHMKITTMRILISVEERLQHGARNGSGLLVYAATAAMEKGKPWVMIPLECVASYRFVDKKELQIQADKLYMFRSSKAKDIYAALQQVLPGKAM